MDKTQIKNFLKENQLKPIKKFGQNFLINQNIIQQIVQQVKKYPPPFVEIGPGLGALTSHLKDKKKDTLLIERDKKLADWWKEKGWNVFCADALNFQWKELPKTFTLFGNLPYEIAGSLIIKASLQQKQIPNMICTMQKEVAQRTIAQACSKNYGLLSVMSQVFWNITTIADIPKTDFYPVPKVEGRVLKFQAKKTSNQLQPSLFLKFIRQSFSLKRKMLFKQIEGIPSDMAKKVLADLGLRETCRAEELSPLQFVKLYSKIKNNKARLELLA